MDEVSAELSTLDLLRSFAVLLVTFCHLFAELGWFIPVGQLAVFFFFVHTSNVLMMSLGRMHQNQPYRLWSRFMVRRFFRIYPLAVLVIAFVWIFRVPTEMRPDGSFYPIVVNTPQLVSNFLLTMNLTHAPVVHGVCWTLPLELQMYLLLPAIFLLIQRTRRPGILVLSIWAFAMVVAFVRPHVPYTSRLNVLDYAPMFISGVLAYVIAGKRHRSLPFWILPAALIIVTVIAAKAPSRYSRLTDCILLLAIAVLLPHIRETSSSFVRTSAHAIAKYSYGIYLVHVIALSIAFGLALSLAAKLLLFFLVVAVAPVLLYRVLEEPLIRLGRRLTDRPVPTIPSKATAAADAATA